MKLSHWCLMFLSSLLYALPFLLNAYPWWLIFIFPVPFLYVVSIEDFSFKHGFVWSLITFLLHMIGGICVTAQMAHNSWFLGLSLAIGMIVIQAFFVGLLFWVIGTVNRWLALPFYKLCTALCMLFIFIVWVDRYSLFIFDVIEGYPLMHPLIVLISCPALLWLLPIIGKSCLTILFLLPSVSLISLQLFKDRIALLFCIIIFLLWALIFYIGIIADRDQKQSWLHTIKPLPYMIVNQSVHSENMLKVTLLDIKTVIAQHFLCSLFIMPESSLNVATDIATFDFTSVPDEIKSKHLIFGSSRMQNNSCYNALVWMYNGQIQYCFDKRHAMLLSERLPWCLNTIFMRQLYFNEGRSEVTTSSNQRQKIVIDGVGSFVPYICSELFFNECPDDTWHDIPILVLVNDSIFYTYRCSAYIGTMLSNLTKFKAMQWQREIVYVSYTQSFYVNKHGIVIAL